MRTEECPAAPVPAFRAAAITIRPVLLPDAPPRAAEAGAGAAELIEEAI